MLMTEIDVMLVIEMLVTEMMWIGACNRDAVDLDREGELIQKWIQR